MRGFTGYVIRILTNWDMLCIRNSGTYLLLFGHIITPPAVDFDKSIHSRCILGFVHVKKQVDYQTIIKCTCYIKGAYADSITE